MAEYKIRNNEISNTDELMAYLREKARNHHYFKYYAKKTYIEAILADHAVFLSDGRNWNDKADSARISNSEDGYTRYALCLSFSKSESVAMWMLYGGNNGCMIDIPLETIKEITSATKIELGYFQDNSFCSKKTLDCAQTNFVLEITDIIYYGKGAENEESYYVKRSDEINKEFARNLVDKLGYQRKKVSWSYENECRIVLSIRSELTCKSFTHAKIEFPEEHIKNLMARTYYSPNSSETDGKYKSSVMKADLNWDLCRNCHKKDK